LILSRSWIMGLLAAAIGGAVVGLVLLTRDLADMQRRLANEIQERSRQLAQIGMGLAHEIRNPLHTLRINLHTLKRSLSRTPLNENELNDMMRESDAEIDHVDALVRDFVQYTVPQGGERVDIDLAREIQATVNLLGEESRRKEVEVNTKTAERPVVVHMEPARLRQIALNLLTFAQNSAGPRGVVQIDVGEREGRAHLTIADSGPALSGTELARLFEPFQGANHLPAGLGLALVQRFVEEAGGKIDRRRQTAVGGCFCVSLPLANHHSQGTLQ
jgi:signal transduction histidine kinase